MKPSGVKLEYKGLIRKLDYQYQIESLGGNWPIVVVPSSGVFVASSKTGVIDAQVLFCSDASVCSDSNTDVMDYNINYSSMINNNNLFTILRAKIFEKGTNGSDAVFSKEKLVECQECISQPIVNIPTFLSLNKINDDDNDITTSEFDIRISNLKSNEWRNIKYNYTITNEYSNWPVSVFPVSGTIIANTDTISIPTKIKFSKNVIGDLPYTEIDGGNSSSFSILTPTGVTSEFTFINSDESKDMMAILRVSVESYASFEPVYHSNPMIVRCDNCIVDPYLTLTAIASNNSFDREAEELTPFIVKLKNLPTNIECTYELRALRSDWPFIVIPDTQNITYIPELIMSSGETLSVANNSIEYRQQGSTQSRTVTAVMNGMFCKHSSMCPPSGQKGVLPYVLDNSLYKFDQYKPSIVLQAVAKIVGSDNEYLSNLVTLTCTDCVGSYSPVIIK
jgi:hypothetical protein